VPVRRRLGRGQDDRVLDGFRLERVDVEPQVCLRVRVGGRGPAVALDSVPIGEALARADARFAQRWWHWFFFAQAQLPERVILADPDAWYRTGT
jgi:hypothetical protein